MTSRQDLAPAPWGFNSMDLATVAETEAAGAATPGERARLEADRPAWVWTLHQLLDETEGALDSAGQLQGDERDQVLADLRDEVQRLTDALVRAGGLVEDPPAARGAGPQPGPTPAPRVASVPVLQASWAAGRVVLWAGADGSPPVPAADVTELATEAGAGTAWEKHGRVSLPEGVRTEAVSAPVAGVLGWLVGVGGGQVGHEVGPSVRWLAQVAVWATELTAEGRFVPSLRRSGPNADGVGRFSVRWVPALIDGARLRSLAVALPGAVTVVEPAGDAAALCRSVLSGMVDAICRQAASRLSGPAPTTASTPVTVSEVAETALSLLDGRRFEAGAVAGGELANRLDRWARPVTTPSEVKLVVRLDPPEASGGWKLAVWAEGVDRQPQPVEVAMVTAGGAKRRSVEADLVRLERLLPVLRRPGGHRRGEVILAGDEAWDLMTLTGPILVAAGFHVEIPQLSRRRPAPTLRLAADPARGDTAVGARQLADVRWSVLFDDVELTAEDIVALSAQARPLVRSRGRWVALDRVDLDAARAALLEKATTTRMSGAAIVRHALGLEAGALGGRVSVAGSGWAADLVRRATVDRPAPAQPPPGFRGKLRSYQAEALGWLGFLDSAELGGCLALDMGLGKTPTMLAHLAATRGNGPALVIAPPAVLGNWAVEAARFTPRLRIAVHHGAGRAGGTALAARIANVDVVLTTYGTATRDVDALVDFDWARIVVDEAQALKNPATDAATALARIPARSRIALTGTPIENGLGDLWAILEFTNPGLVGDRNGFITSLSTGGDSEAALRALNGLVVFRRTKAEPEIAAELPDKIDELDHCSMTTEQIGLYQAVIDKLTAERLPEEPAARQGAVLAAITALKQICDHPAAYTRDDEPLEGRSGKLSRLDDIVEVVFAAGERLLVFTHFATWGERLATHLSRRTGTHVSCYHGGLSRTQRDQMVYDFQHGKGTGILVLSLTAGGTGLNLAAANHVVLYDRWWNPAKEDQARDRAWRIGQTKTVVCHRLVCPGTIDERVEEVVAGKRRVADLVLPKSSTLADLDPDQLRVALGLQRDAVLEDDDRADGVGAESAASARA